MKDLSHLPTPETDAAAYYTTDSQYGLGDWVTDTDHARRLERERDHARLEIKEIAGCFDWGKLASGISLKDEIQRVVLDLKAQNSSAWSKVHEVEAERDQAREQVRALREALDGIANMPKYDQDDAHRLRHIARGALEATKEQP